MLSLVLIVVGLAIVCYAWWNARHDFTETPEGNTQVQAPPETQNQEKSLFGPVIVYYATQTGTAERFARTLIKEAKEHDIVCVSRCIDEFSIDELQKDDSICVFLISTHYEGEPTDDMSAIWKKMAKLKDSNLLKRLKYTGFSLGDQNYKYFNQMGRLFSKKLEDLGALKIADFGEGTNHAGQIEEHFEEWNIPLWNQLYPHLPKVSSDVAHSIWESSDPNSYTVLIDSTISSSGTSASKYQSETEKYLRSFEGEIIAIKELRQKPGATDSTLHVDIRLPENASYKTGENLKIYPQTSKELVHKLLNHLDLNPKSTLSFESKSKLPFPSTITVEELFTHYIDLQGYLKKTTIKALQDIAKTENAKTELKCLYEDKSKLDSLHQKMWNIVDLLITLDIKPNIKELLTIADRISVDCFHPASTIHNKFFCSSIAKSR